MRLFLQMMHQHGLQIVQQIAHRSGAPPINSRARTHAHPTPSLDGGTGGARDLFVRSRAQCLRRRGRHLRECLKGQLRGSAATVFWCQLRSRNTLDAHDNPVLNVLLGMTKLLAKLLTDGTHGGAAHGA